MPYVVRTWGRGQRALYDPHIFGNEKRTQVAVAPLALIHPPPWPHWFSLSPETTSFQHDLARLTKRSRVLPHMWPLPGQAADSFSAGAGGGAMPGATVASLSIQSGFSLAVQSLGRGSLAGRPQVCTSGNAGVSMTSLLPPVLGADSLRRGRGACRHAPGLWEPLCLPSESHPWRLRQQTPAPAWPGPAASPGRGRSRHSPALEASGPRVCPATTGTRTDSAPT